MLQSTFVGKVDRKAKVCGNERAFCAGKEQPAILGFFLLSIRISDELWMSRDVLILPANSIWEYNFHCFSAQPPKLCCFLQRQLFRDVQDVTLYLISLRYWLQHKAIQDFLRSQPSFPELLPEWRKSQQSQLADNCVAYSGLWYLARSQPCMGNSSETSTEQLLSRSIGNFELG